MKFIFKMVTAAALVSGGNTYAQTADEIVDKHIAAIGGSDVLNSIKSQVVETTISVMGNDLPSVTSILIGKGFKNVANFNGQEIISVYTPTSGWVLNPFAGFPSPQALSEAEVKGGLSSFEAGGELFNYKDKGSTIELAGMEKVDGKDTYKIKVTSKDSKLSTLYLDSATYYIVRRESIASVNGQDMQVVENYSDYKKTDVGHVIPFSWTSNQGFDLVFKVNKVTYNTEIDPKIFEMPKQ